MCAVCVCACMFVRCRCVYVVCIIASLSFACTCPAKLQLCVYFLTDTAVVVARSCALCALHTWFRRGWLKSYACFSVEQKRSSPWEWPRLLPLSLAPYARSQCCKPAFAVHRSLDWKCLHSLTPTEAASNGFVRTWHIHMCC